MARQDAHEDMPAVQRVAIVRHVGRAAAAAVLSLLMLLGTSQAASADTDGYGHLSMDRVGNLRFEFGVPAWVTDNRPTRTAAVGACSAYIGNALGLKWWLWWAPEFVCDKGLNAVGFTPNEGKAVCGSIPLENVWGTRVWAC